MGKILEVNDLKYAYGEIRALKGISLDVEQGEVVTIIGANGAGKTTALQSISGLLDQRGKEGTIVFDGHPIHKMSPDKITSLGMVQVLEGRHIFPQLTVRENLQMGAYLRKDKAGIEEDIKDVFRRFPRLEERQKQSGATLSGGEQQMLAIARALLAKPKMILLDEPSLGLAPLIVAEVFDVIREISREGISILLVEQNSKMALKVANRGYVLQNGEIIAHDKSENLMDNEDVRKSYLGG